VDVGTIVLLVYLAGCMGFLVPTARFVHGTFGGQTDTETMAMTAAIALCFVWAWPLYIPGWWVVQMLKSSDR
jgi:hypothetical protein